MTHEPARATPFVFGVCVRECVYIHAYILKVLTLATGLRLHSRRNAKTMTRKQCSWLLSGSCAFWPWEAKSVRVSVRVVKMLGGAGWMH